MTSSTLSAVLLRAHAVARDLSDIASVRGSNDKVQAVAAHQIRSLVDAVAVQALRHHERAVDDADFLVRISPLLGYLTLITEYADLLFSREVNVPVSLIRSVRRELDRLSTPGQGGSDVQPLITVGHPGNFETDSASMWDSLYRPDNLPNVALEPPEQRVHVFSIPGVEGRRAMWAPIAVGHEVAHIAHATRSLVDTLDIASWVDDADVSAWHESAGGTRQRYSLRFLQELLVSWAREVLCDVYAVRRFGPAFIAAQCDFLASVSAEKSSQLGEHPPPEVRVDLMLATLPSMGETYAEMAKSWTSWASTGAGDDAALRNPVMDGMVATLRTHADEIAGLLSAVDVTTYDLEGRQDVVNELVVWFLAGIPGSETAAGLTVEEADILNAGWVATHRLLPPRPVNADGQVTAVPSKSTSEIGALVAQLGGVDALVSKSLDNVDFRRLWSRGQQQPAEQPAEEQPTEQPTEQPAEEQPTEQPAEQQPAEQQPAEEQPAQQSAAQGSPPTSSNVPGDPKNPAQVVVGGVLTEVEIRRRLELGLDIAELGKPDTEALVVTPRTALHVSGATMDVRLGREFITFKRTSTESFSAALQRREPREMQEAVEKDWGGNFILHPGELVLASTLEYVQLPGDLTAQVITRSSYGRLGLLSATAVQVQPRFTGSLTLELVNLGQMPLTLVPGERIAQLVFTRAYPPADPAASKYSYPTGPQFSRVGEDSDLQILRTMIT